MTQMCEVGERMSTENFRRQLRAESERWWREGLIDAQLYEQLATRYQFEHIEAATGNRFISILIGLGGILLGLGAITLVAANWQDWSRTLRMVVIFGAFIGVNTTGFYLWRRPASKPGFQRLGLSLLLPGALLMGANIGLMSQIYHQSGSVSALYLVWGLGVLAMAYSLRLTPLGVLSWVLIGLSYREALFGSWFARGVDESAWIELLQTYLPVLVTPLYLPLAHWCRSRVLYGFWGIASTVMLLVANGSLVHWHAATFAYVGMLPAVILWVYHARFWKWPSDHMARLVAERSPLHKQLSTDGMPTDVFQPIGRSLAIWFVSIGAYIYSFEWFWKRSGTYDGGASSVSKSYLLLLIGLSAIALYGLWQYFIRSRQSSERTSEPKALWMKTPVYFVVVTLIGLSAFFQFHGAGNIWPLWLVLTNSILFFIGFAMLHDGMLMGVRHRFWGGMGIVVLGLWTRMFEYDTDLLLKAAVLAACGVAVIAAGLWFEKSSKSSMNVTS